MHRRENHHNIQQWFRELDSLALTHSDYLFTLPIHPNPNVKKHIVELKHITVVDPMPHAALLDYLCNCSYVITDSGGIQEEASFYGKRVLVCRKATERPASNQILVAEPSLLGSLFDEQLEIPLINKECPFGVGDSSERIYSIMKEMNIL